MRPTRAELIDAFLDTHPREVTMSTLPQRHPSKPRIDHALAIARLVSIDGAPRAYEHPWADETELRTFLSWLTDHPEFVELNVEADAWLATQSAILAYTHAGKVTGLELRITRTP